MHVRLERSDGVLEDLSEDAARSVVQHVTLGPWPWVQLTYEELRVAPDGDVIAHYADSGWWLVRPEPGPGRGGHAARMSALSVTAADYDVRFSDVVVYE